MAIRTQQEGTAKHNIVFPQHALAHQWLDGDKVGYELGAAAHNPFGLEHAINVAPGDDNHIYRAAEIDMCGAYAIIDIKAEAHALPCEDNALDYVISSHVFEHLPDPLAALREWIRVIRDGGIIFMIVPLPGALEADKGRPLATSDDWLWASGGITVDTWDYEAKPVPGGRRGHYYVYSPDHLAEIIQFFFPESAEQCWLELIDREDVDSKVGNGFTLVYRVHKPTVQTEVSAPDANTEEVAAEIPEPDDKPVEEVVAEPVTETPAPRSGKAKKQAKTG